jgi:hypothetical protein
MLKSKSILDVVMLIAALLGLIVVIGCGGSAVKQEMSDLLMLYSDTVNEYQAADENKRTELKEKIESYRLKCSNMISEMELNNNATPQVIKELEKEYKEITKKYTSLSS